MQSGKPLFQLTYQAKLQFLHYLRHILREITYLPDPVARKIHHDYILYRFRAYRPAERDAQPSPWGVSQKRVRDEQHLDKLLHDCKKRLGWQYRAGNGDLKALKKALFLAYGRVGRRKHELLRPYIQPDIPVNVEELKNALTSERSFKLPMSTALKAIAQEQGRQAINFMTATDINMRRFFKDVLPTENIWGKPMPQCRLANTKGKMFLELISKLYPPLPGEEFRRLKDLATGIAPCPPLPVRRTRLEGLPELPKVVVPHRTTPRTMRRLWSYLLGYCSTVEKDKGAYKVLWGSAKYTATNRVQTGNEGISLFAQTIGPH